MIRQLSLEEFYFKLNRLVNKYSEQPKTPKVHELFKKVSHLLNQYKRSIK